MGTDLTMFFRYLLMIGVGHLVTKGYVEASAIELYVGAGLALLTVGWKYVERRLQKDK